MASLLIFLAAIIAAGFVILITQALVALVRAVGRGIDAVARLVARVIGGAL